MMIMIMIMIIRIRIRRKYHDDNDCNDYDYYDKGRVRDGISHGEDNDGNTDKWMSD